MFQLMKLLFQVWIAPAFGLGTLPTVASVTAALTSYPTVYYDRVAVMELRNNLKLYDCIEQKQMPDMSGVAMQIFGYTKLASNTVAATDGTPQAAGVALTASTGRCSGRDDQ